MAESRTESSYYCSDSFTHLKVMQNAVHIYTLTSCSNRDSTVSTSWMLRRKAGMVDLSKMHIVFRQSILQMKEEEEEKEFTPCDKDFD